jgi:hypothetical protein
MSNEPQSPAPVGGTAAVEASAQALADSPTRSSTTARTWGFRFSLTDAVALSAFGAATAVLYRMGSGFSWIVAIVAGHFFLFCNVFRVARRRELLWAGFFVLNSALWLVLGRLDGFGLLACQLPVSVGVIAWELGATRYHGIFANHLNSALEDYLHGRIP